MSYMKNMSYRQRKNLNRFQAFVLVMVMTVTSVFGVLPGELVVTAEETFNKYSITFQAGNSTEISSDIFTANKGTGNGVTIQDVTTGNKVLKMEGATQILFSTTKKGILNINYCVFNGEGSINTTNTTGFSNSIAVTGTKGEKQGSGDIKLPIGSYTIKKSGGGSDQPGIYDVSFEEGYKINYTAGTGGSVSISSERYDPDIPKFNVKAIPDTGYKLISWTIGDEIVGTNQKLTSITSASLDHNVEVKANFAPADGKITVNYKAFKDGNDNNKVSPTSEEAWYDTTGNNDLAKGSTAENGNRTFIAWIDADTGEVVGTEKQFIPSNETLLKAASQGKTVLNYAAIFSTNQYYYVTDNYVTSGKGTLAKFDGVDLPKMFNVHTSSNGGIKGSKDLTVADGIYVNGYYKAYADGYEFISINSLGKQTLDLSQNDETSHAIIFKLSFPTRNIVYKVDSSSTEYGSIARSSDPDNEVSQLEQTIDENTYKNKGYSKFDLDKVVVKPKDDYVFLGWKLEGAAVAESTATEFSAPWDTVMTNTDNTTFDENGDPISYTITYVAQFGTVGYNITADVDVSNNGEGIGINESYYGKGYGHINDNTDNTPVVIRTDGDGILKSSITATCDSEYFEFDKWRKVEHFKVSAIDELKSASSETSAYKDSVKDYVNLLYPGINTDLYCTYDSRNSWVTEFDVITDFTDEELADMTFDPYNPDITADNSIFNNNYSIRAFFKQKDDVMRIDYVPNLINPEGYYATQLYLDGTDKANATDSIWTVPPTAPDGTAASSGRNDYFESQYYSYLHMPVVTEYLYKGNTPLGCHALAYNYYDNDDTKDLYRFIAWNDGNSLLNMDKGGSGNTVADGQIVLMGQPYFRPWYSLLVDENNEYKDHLIFVADSRKAKNRYVTLRVNHSDYGITTYNSQNWVDKQINIETNLSKAVGYDNTSNKYTIKGWVFNGEFMSYYEVYEKDENGEDKLDDKGNKIVDHMEGDLVTWYDEHGQEYTTLPNNDPIPDDHVTRYIYWHYKQHETEYINNEVNYAIAVFEPVDPYIAINYEIKDGTYAEHGYIVDGREIDTWFLVGQVDDPQSVIEGGLAQTYESDYVVDHWEDRLGNVVLSGRTEYVPNLATLEKQGYKNLVQYVADPNTGETVPTLTFYAVIEPGAPYQVQYKVNVPEGMTESDFEITNAGPQTNIRVGSTVKTASARVLTDADNWEFYCWKDKNGKIVSTDPNFSPSYYLIKLNAEGADNLATFTANFYYVPEVRGTVTLNKKLDGSDTLITFSPAVFALYKENEVSPKSVVDNGDGTYTYADSLSETTVTAMSTDSSGSITGTFTINNIPKGNYYLKEEIAPESCEMSEDKYYFSVVNNNDTSEIVVYNKPAENTLTIRKTIRDYVEDYGTAVFMFEIKGTSAYNKARNVNTVDTYYCRMEFNGTGEQLETLNIPSGEYTIREVQTSRYVPKDGVYKLENDNGTQIVNAYYVGDSAVDDKIIISSDTTAYFENELKNYKSFSHADNKKNQFTADDEIVRLTAELKTEGSVIPIGAAADEIKNLLTVKKITNGDSDGTIINAADFSISSYDSSASMEGQQETVCVTYAENGITYRAYVVIQVEPLLKIIYNASPNGYYNYDANYVIKDNVVGYKAENGSVKLNDSPAVLGAYISPNYDHEAYVDYAYAMYDFVGWYATALSGTNEGNETGPYAEDTTIETIKSELGVDAGDEIEFNARYVKRQYTITYHGAPEGASDIQKGKYIQYNTDGTETGVDTYVSTEVYYLSEDGAKPDTYLLTFTADVEGYKFAGWNRDREQALSGNVEYAPGYGFSKIAVYGAENTNSNVDLYAVYKQFYTVTYDNGKQPGDSDGDYSGTMRPRQYTPENDMAEITLDKNLYGKVGYLFVGWIANEDVEMNGVTVSAGQTIPNLAQITISSDVTLTAQYKKYYRVIFKVNNNQMAAAVKDVVQYFTEDDFQKLDCGNTMRECRPSFDIVGWSTSSLADNTNATTDANFNSEGTAYYKPIDKIEYDSSNGIKFISGYTNSGTGNTNELVLYAVWKHQESGS